ncbi:hypothetical protein DBT46_005850, partial [Aerococcus mictus]|uniref:hypothetical protein n=1 Tax=Aerococcus mictus TaxID=2976810 RepID=UPI000DCBDD0E
ARGYSERIAQLVEVLDSFEGAYRDSIIGLVEDAKRFDADDREVVRASARKYLNWHNSYNSEGERKSRSAVGRLRVLFDELASPEPVHRHAWLFSNGWVDLPDGRDEDFEKQEEQRKLLRANALLEVLSEGGLNALTDLAERSGNPWLVGWQIAQAEMEVEPLARWVVEEFRKAGATFQQPLISGILHGSTQERRSALFAAAMNHLSKNGLPEEIAAFVSSLPGDQDTWTLLKTQSELVQSIYWRAIRLGYLRSDDADRTNVIERLLSVDRPRTAFQAVSIDLAGLAPELIIKILDNIRVGLEPDGPLPEGWHVGEAIATVQLSGAAPRRALALLEFAFYRALEHDKHGVKN